MGAKKDIAIAATKAMTNTAASTASHDPGQIVATALSETLSFALDTFQALSHKRANQLFDSEHAMRLIVDQVHASEDFASLVYDIWTKYTFESSERRRNYLKNILENAATDADRDYTNFSRIISLSQQISPGELKLLSFLYTYSNPLVFPRSTTFGEQRSDARNEDAIRDILQKARYDISASELTLTLNQLGNFGLIMVSYGAMGGNVYTPIEFGKIFLEYVRDDGVVIR